MEERVQKILSNFGIASRRQAEKMILDGRVRINGNTAQLGDTADVSEDVIQVDGVRLKKAPEKRYIVLNKPRGYVTTMSCEKGRKNVSDLVRDCPERVYPVGRLDMYSEGLLLMTNDGEFANRMTHPREEVCKTYHVWVSGFHIEQVAKMKSSIEIDGRMTKPAKVKVLNQNGTVAMLEFIISEGRNRQIRRLCEAAGAVVTRLKRISEGGLNLGDLAVGTWRDLSEEERRKLGI